MLSGLFWFILQLVWSSGVGWSEAYMILQKVWCGFGVVLKPLAA